MADLARTPSQTTTPGMTTAAPAAQTAGPAAAPSNAAAQDALGLTAATPEPAADLSLALATMGAVGAVVLDSLPCGVALRLAATLLHVPWVREWIGALSGTAAEEALDTVLDTLWPVGFAVTVEGGVSGAVGFDLEGREAATVERTKDGWRVEAGGEVAVELGASAGAEATGAFGESLGGAIVGATGGTRAKATFAWLLAPDRATRGIAGAVDVGELAGAPAPSAMRRVAEALCKLVAARAPDEVALATAGSVEATGEVGDELGRAAPIAGSAEAGAEVGLAVGYAGGRGFVEAHVSGSAGAGARETAEILERFGLGDVAEVAAEIGGAFRVRVEDDVDAIAGGAPHLPLYRVTRESADADGSEADALETRYAAAVLAWAAGMLGVDATAADGAIPDVALRRSVVREVEDPSTLEGPMPGWIASLGEWLPEKGVVASVSDTRLEAEVVVPREAALAALDGAPLPVGEDGPVEALLDVERAIAGEVLGTWSDPSLTADLDLDAGLAESALERSELVAEVAFGVGAGGAIAELAGAGAEGDASLTVTARTDLPAKLPEPARLALFAGA